MRIGTLVKFKKQVMKIIKDETKWIGLVVEPCVQHQFEGTVAMIQWMCYDTPTPEYVDDLEVICE